MTEFEIDALLQIENIRITVQKLKQSFVQNEASLLKLSENDFLSLVLITPSVSLAISDGNISFSEELDLNKKARKLSKGKYFLEKDPVVKAMEFLIKDFDKWEDQFYELIRCVLDLHWIQNDPTAHLIRTEKMSEEEYVQHIMSSPYILIRFLAIVFLNDDEDILKPHKLARVEFLKLKEIGTKLKFDDIPIYKMFINHIEVKD